MKKLFLLCLLFFMSATISLSATASEAQNNIQIYKESCHAGDRYSCTLIGAMYLTGRGVKQSDEKAFSYYLRACKDDDFVGCIALTAAIHDERGIKDNIAPLLQFGCDRDNAEMCFILGDMYLNGKDVKQDDGKAFNLFTKSCNGNEYYGCNGLAMLYIQSKGTVQNIPKAVSLLDKSCNQKNGQGCYGLAQLYYHGIGVTKSLEEGNKLVKKACKFGDDHSCKKLNP